MDILLHVKDLSISFGGIQALSSVSFEVKRGAIFALIGPNGAGKSTIFNCINRLYPPQCGEILFEEVNLLHLKPHLIPRSGVGRTFQNIALFAKMSVMDNLLVARHARIRSGLFSHALRLRRSQEEERKARSEAERILDFLGLSPVRNQVVSSLPYGSQKRVELGRALAMGPRLLLLDEPVAGMNVSETESMAQLIREIRAELGMTILLIEHDMRLVMTISDWVCVLNYGRKIAEGLPREIQDHPQVIEAYLGRERRGARRP